MGKPRFRRARTCPGSHGWARLGCLVPVNNPAILHVGHAPCFPWPLSPSEAPQAEACVYQEPLSLSLTAGDQRGGGVTEASSLLGGSPRRPCGRKGSPYHTGQLHPAVRVADLLQHINQMKTAEGYGFKQEYEVQGPSPARSPRQGLAWFLTVGSDPADLQSSPDGPLLC